MHKIIYGSLTSIAVTVGAALISVSTALPAHAYMQETQARECAYLHEEDGRVTLKNECSYTVFVKYCGRENATGLPCEALFVTGGNGRGRVPSTLSHLYDSGDYNICRYGTSEDFRNPECTN